MGHRSVVRLKIDMTVHSADKLGYYSHLRHDVLRHVPLHARCVLSVGCGNGVTESTLVERGVTVVGIEQNPAAAAEARSRGVIVFERDASVLGEYLSEWQFDCVVYADVLEHLADAPGILKCHMERLGRDGTVVISVPNFRHWSVLWQLGVQGCPEYRDAGIMDRTHVWITTRKLVSRWCRDAGLRIISTEYRLWRRRDRWLSLMSANMLIEFIAQQVIIEGRR